MASMAVFAVALTSLWLCAPAAFAADENLRFLRTAGER